MPNSSFSHQRRFRNNGAVPRLLMVEPVGEDYWIAPGDALDFWFAGQESAFFVVEGEDMFGVEQGGHMTALYPPDCYDWAVCEGDQQVGCGHNRPLGWGAALQAKYDERVDAIKSAHPELPDPPELSRKG